MHLKVSEKTALPLASLDIEADLDLLVGLVVVDQRNFVFVQLEFDLLRIHFVGSHDKLALDETARERHGLHHLDQCAFNLELPDMSEAWSY